VRDVCEVSMGGMDGREGWEGRLRGRMRGKDEGEDEREGWGGGWEGRKCLSLWIVRGSSKALNEKFVLISDALLLFPPFKLNEMSEKEIYWRNGR
jgi:hypothetical protein